MRATLGHLDPLRRPTRTVDGAEVPITLGQRVLPSRLGLAAGMDKDAEAVLGMSALGFADEIARPDELYHRYGPPECDPAWRP